jgi:uncharacterized membrane protein YphA (DoxX/SURF4 family)
MAIDRQGTGLVIIRVCLGVFFIFSAYGKLRGRWFTDSSILKGQFEVWLQNVPPGSTSQAYLQRFAIPGVAVLARLVPAGEFICGLALLVGFWTPIFALIAFVMVLNYNIASGAIFELGFLANRAGLLVLASTLGLAVGGIRLRWSLR